jgi:hypothetical protein
MCQLLVAQPLISLELANGPRKLQLYNDLAAGMGKPLIVEEYGEGAQWVVGGSGGACGPPQGCPPLQVELRIPAAWQAGIAHGVAPLQPIPTVLLKCSIPGLHHLQAQHSASSTRSSAR